MRAARWRSLATARPLASAARSVARPTMCSTDSTPTVSVQPAACSYLRLVALGEGNEDTRQRVNRAELPEPLAALVDPLVGARLLTADDHNVEVAHEALIREWPRLRHWLDDERDALRVHRHVTAASNAWARADRDPAELYGGARLQAALEWQTSTSPILNEIETQFSDASQRRQRTTTRRRRLLTVALATLTVVALMTALIALGAQRRASTNARRANEQRREADMRRRLADARASETQNLSRALLLAREVSLHETSVRATGALETALTSNPALLGYMVGDGAGFWSTSLTDDGATLVTGRLDGRVDVWNTTTRTPTETLPPFSSGQVVATVDPSGSVAPVARNDGTYATRDLRAHRMLNPGSPPSARAPPPCTPTTPRSWIAAAS